eukprot:sb/3471613/
MGRVDWDDVKERLIDFKDSFSDRRWPLSGNMTCCIFLGIAGIIVPGIQYLSTTRIASFSAWSVALTAFFFLLKLLSILVMIIAIAVLVGRVSIKIRGITDTPQSILKGVFFGSIAALGLATVAALIFFVVGGLALALLDSQGVEEAGETRSYYGWMVFLDVVAVGLYGANCAHALKLYRDR